LDYVSISTMKKLKFNLYSIAAIICSCLYGCEPIYIIDPIDPRLPKYTEEGYDVAGAFINDKFWKSAIESGGSIYYPSPSNDPQVYSYNESDSLIIQFGGKYEDGRYQSILFSLSGFGIVSREKWVTLNDKKIVLDGVTNFATLGYVSQDYCTTLGTGQLYFRRVSYNQLSNSVTFSGTFSFTQQDDSCGNYIITYGRFDFDF
jgi:hypothetical protein